MSAANVILSLWLLLGGGVFFWLSVVPIRHGEGE